MDREADGLAGAPLPWGVRDEQSAGWLPTDVAVIRRGRIEASRALRVGCFDLRSAVADFLALSHALLPPPDVIEDLIRRVDASGPDTVMLSLEFDDSARSGGGERRTIPVERTAILAAMETTLLAIAGVVRDVWAALPEETRAEVGASGLWLTGGGARLRLLVERVRDATSVEPRIPEDPLHAVIDGASRMALFGG